MLQSPPPYVPVVEYVLKALEHPPFMYVSKLAACCTMLFLTRENPELLQELCHKWALRFQQDRYKLISCIRNRVSHRINSLEASTEQEISNKVNSEDVGEVTDGESSNKDAPCNANNEEEMFGGMRCCDTDTAVEHLLSILNTFVPMYFSWNWHRADYVIQINKEYEAYVREFILPVCAAQSPEEGVDDEEHTPWLLPPHTYLDASKCASAFYSPTSGIGLFPPGKAGNLVEGGGRYGAIQNGGGSSSTAKLAGAATLPSVVSNKATAEIDGDDYRSLSSHFADNVAGRRSAERQTGVASTQLAKFSPMNPTFSSGAYKERLMRTTSQTPSTEKTATTTSAASTAPDAMQPADLQGSSASITSGLVMSPNATSAGAFNTAAVYGLSFLTLSNYRAALQRNTRGLVTVFHAKYSARSNEVIDAFQQIMTKRLLNPMPTIAVVYAVAEPELSTLYKVSWFPTIVYTPPLCSQQQYKRDLKVHPRLQTPPDCASGRSRLSAASKRHHPSRRQRPSSHCQRRWTTNNSVGKPQSTPSQPLSGSDSLLDESLTIAATAAAVSPGAENGVRQYEEEERTKCVSLNGNSNVIVKNRRNAETSNAIAVAEKHSAVSPHPAVPLEAFSTGKAAASNKGVPSLIEACSCAVTPNHLSPFWGGGQSDLSPSPSSGVSAPLPVSVARAPTPTELLFGISVVGTTPRHLDGPPSPELIDRSGGVEDYSCHSSVDDSALPLTQLPTTEHHPPLPQRQQPLMEMVQHDDHVIYPLRGVLTVPALVEWIGSRGASVPRLGKLRYASICLKAIREEEKFKRFRELHSAVVTLRRLQGQGPQEDLFGGGGDADAGPGTRRIGETGDRRSAQPPQPSPQERPLFIFLGGGMAAGKTTAVAALAKSNWWQGHKEQSVVVNADEFKLPWECELASDEAHKHSTRAAENLLVRAVNQGRSIVLDGTMMWKPFVQQVVSMIRAAHLSLFRQGPGYNTKTKTEQYFLSDKQRQPPLPFPYKIVFLGITVDVETAVPRGFLRKFSSNRGVPISMQLRSFKSFAENFADYVAMMDETTLYNNNVFVNLEKGELPPVMAECNAKTGNKLLIHDEAAFQQFVKQQLINENADNVMQVYPSSPMTPDSSA